MILYCLNLLKNTLIYITLLITYLQVQVITIQAVKLLQKQLDSIKPNYPPFKIHYRLPRHDKEDDYEHYAELCRTLDWVLRHAFFDSIITRQVNCETYMIIYIDFKKAIKILSFIPFYAYDEETVGRIIECQKFFIEYKDFNAYICKDCVREHINKRIEFIDHKIKISEKEMLDKVRYSLGIGI